MRPLGMSAFHACQLLGVATIGYGFAATGRAVLLGWADEPWQKTVTNAVRLVFEFLRKAQPQQV